MGAGTGAPQPRKDVESGRARSSSSNGVPTSFFIASESMLQNASLETSRAGVDSNFGVHSLQDTMYGDNSHDGDEEDDEDREDHTILAGRRRSTIKPLNRSRESSIGNPKLLSTEHTRESSPGQAPSPPRVSLSSTSLSLASQAQDSSLASSPKSTSSHSMSRSLRPSEADSIDDAASQAIMSDEEDGIEPPSTQDSVPQLIMPSIQMPSRRPFTENGKRIGRLKVLVAGAPGVGKTSLIKSIVQTCEDIVHVDPLFPHTVSLGHTTAKKAEARGQRPKIRPTDIAVEVFASTKAYPNWWSEIEENKLFRRRKSMGDVVLERNICFVDTPGYDKTSPAQGTSALHYVEAQLAKALSVAAMNEAELVALLSGEGGSLVDLVLYLVTEAFDDEEAAHLRRLSTVANVVPLIAKVDLLSQESLQALQTSLVDKFQTAGVRPFPLSSVDLATIVHTVSAAPSNDEENMDASLLMSSEYVRPLLPSSLTSVVHHMFDAENVLRFRALAARKIIYNRAIPGTPAMPSPFALSAAQSPLPRTISPLSTPSSPSHASLPIALTQSPYIQATILDHTQREEKLAQVRLARWAMNLQKGIQDERTQFEAMARNERANWLSKKLGEYNSGENVISPEARIPMDLQEKGLQPFGKAFVRQHAPRSFKNASDPLGVLKWSDDVKRRGWLAFQVVGSFGILGAVVVWAAKTWGNGAEAHTTWTWQWWGMES